MKKWIPNIWHSDKKWVLLAIVFFIAWKFFLLYVLWYDRSIAPEPDDSYTYIANIASISQCLNEFLCSHPLVSMHDHSGFTYFSYRFIFGSLAKFFILSPELTYKLSFFLGTFILPFALIPFIQSFTANKKLVALSIFFLAFLHGNGESHGFFWVVPSFFSVLIFFILSSYVLGRKMQIYILVPLVALFVFMHPISVYLTLIFPIYFFIHSFISRNINYNLIKRILIILGTTLFLSFSQTYYLKLNHATDYYSANASFSETRNILNDIFSEKITDRHLDQYSIVNNPANFIDQKISTIYAVYFRWLIPHWLFIFPFFILFLVLTYKKEEKLISFYLSCLVFFLASTFFNEFGFRSVIVLWPVTFLFFAFGTWHFYQILKDISLRPYLKIVILGAFFLSVVIFLFINSLFALTINSNLNIRSNYQFKDNFASYFLENIPKQKTVNIHYILSRTSSGKIILENYRYLPISENPEYIITTTPISTHSSFILAFSSKVSHFLGLGTINDHKNTPLKIPENYSNMASFDSITIYKR